MKLSFLSNFNNYYNRTIKKTFSYLISDYDEYIVRTDSEVNFNQNDNVNSEYIINYNPPISNVSFIDNIVDIDYVIYHDDSGSIDTRWFVIDRQRVTGGQYKLILRRDLIADFAVPVYGSLMFLEKGYLPIDSPLLYNDENMSFNQILKKIDFLYDKSKCPWIVGYIPRDSFQEPTEIEFNYPVETSITPDIIVSNIYSWEYYKYTTTKYGYIHELKNKRVNSKVTLEAERKEPILTLGRTFHWFSGDIIGFGEAYDFDPALDLNYAVGGSGRYRDNIDITFLQNSYHCYHYLDSPLEINGETDAYTTYKLWFRELRDNAPGTNSVLMQTIKNTLPSYFETYFYYNSVNNNRETLSNLLNNKIIKDSNTERLYKISVKPTVFNEELPIKNEQPFASTKNFLDSMFANYFGASTTSTNDTNFFSVDIESSLISLEEVMSNGKVTIDNNRKHLIDQPYDMFCMPYSDDLDIIIHLEDNDKTIKSNKSLATNIANIIGSKTGDKNIFDIQLLPYCPIQQYITVINDQITLDSEDSNLDIIYNLKQEPIGALFWVENSSFTTLIPYTIPDITSSSIDKKVESQTTLYRLTDPGQSHIFEFNPYKNNGVDYFVAYCTYKPYNPYIKVAPDWKGLYGTSEEGQYNRGLICSGDFSLPQVTSAWANYQLNNKNYEAMFNRSIEQMDLHQDVQRLQDNLNIITSGVGAGVQTGVATGNPYLGIAAGIGSLAMGAFDYSINEKLRNDAIDYKKDLFGYQLGNIKAIPQGITKSSPIDIGNPLVPMIIIYSSTDEEKKMFKDKLKYNGFSIMKITTLNDEELNNNFYYKGKLIRLQDGSGASIGEFHEANELAIELDKGWYFI